jgi:hypothetical protein
MYPTSVFTMTTNVCIRLTDYVHIENILTITVARNVCNMETCATLLQSGRLPKRRE